MPATFEFNPANLQLLLVGGSDRLAAELADSLPEGRRQLLHVRGDEWRSSTWQKSRSASQSCAVVCLGEGIPLAEWVECIRLVQISFRPGRLLVMRRRGRLEETLTLASAGADGLLEPTASTADIHTELSLPPPRREEFFPDASQWLAPLSRAAEEMDLGAETGSQLRKLLKIFVSHLKVERASIVLVDGDEIEIAASVGYGESRKFDRLSKAEAGPVLSWVLSNRRPRLVMGKVSGSRSLSSGISSAVSAPILSDGGVAGTVNFSASDEGRQLGQQDLETAEVFAALLGLAIRNRKLLQENLEKERLAAIGSTVGNVSHCLKNLLTIFRGATSLMQLAIERQDMSLAASGFHPIRNAVRRVENLVLDLLDLSRKREPDLEAVELHSFLEEIRTFFLAGHLSGKNVDFQVMCEVDGPHKVDANRLHRALLNLVTNSWDVVKNGGTIRIYAGELDGMLCFEVSDDGPGVPEDKLDSIFDAFYSTKGSAGTGLGLAMVAKFCEENAGAASADHDPQLGGLRVRLLLPLVTVGDFRREEI